jgi:DTW domain-containing protein YfiP
MPPRWCICEGLRPLECPLDIDLLMHFCEANRPSSTRHLIKRLIPSSRIHLAGGGRQPDHAAILRPGKTLWILHQQGDLPPTGAVPENLQVLLIDGSWRQASDLMRSVCTLGKTIRLPMSGESRYRLRAQKDEGKFSTIEALMFLMSTLGLHREEAQLRLEFELHVYAGLLARGRPPDARRFLVDSPVRTAFPDLVARLDPWRPQGDAVPVG